MKRMVGAVACTVLAMGCSVFGAAEDHADISNDPAPPDGPPAPHEVKGTPTESELVEALGVFVTVEGSDDGDGSRAHPFHTLAKGIAAGKELGKRVYVCSGTFEEAVAIEDGVPMVGGLDCASASEWKVGTGRTRIEAPSSPAVRAEGVTRPTRFEGFEVIAPDAKEPSASSIGLFAIGSPGLSIANARIAAGNGAPGQPGSEGIQLVQTSKTLDGQAGYYAAPYAAQPILAGRGGVSTCSGAPAHDGGAGGNGGSGGLYQSKSDVVLGVPQPYAWHVYGGDPANGAKPGQPGTGQGGARGQDGASASSAPRFDANGYAPLDGAPGTDGAPGKGGAGADGLPPDAVLATQHAGELWVGSKGSGGGAGGCPGLAGTPGRGGGASVGALLLDSPITIIASEIVSAGGGAGGRGSLGSSPTAGGKGALTPRLAGNGGNGGASGVSGSGAGGPSFAIAHTAAAPPKVMSTTTKPGNGGTGVPAETTTDALGNTKTLPASATGLSKELYAF